MFNKPKFAPRPVAVLVGALFFLAACARASQSPAEDFAATRIGRAVAPLVAAHPGLSGVYPIRDARDAFAARLRLAQVAERTLDLQYYLWNDDLTGSMLFEAVHAAADRGVHVRLLLDDSGTHGIDRTLAELDSHPNIEVRLFNPFVFRHVPLDFLFDFPRANRRMHNKSFTADHQATIVGGRNVGDEYLGGTDGPLFVDLDVLAVGPVARDVSAEFERYWNCASAHPASEYLPRVDPGRITEITAAASAAARNPDAAGYVEAVRRSRVVAQMNSHRLPLEWDVVRTYSDDPAKGQGRAPREGLLIQKLKRVIGDSASEVELVSAYFVPTTKGVDAFVALRRRGVRIAVLTNSLESTDVIAVHSGYAKRRKDLLRAGVTLYELRSDASPVGATRRRARHRYGKNSSSSLHAKTFAVDRSRIFIGSFNFDRRSRNLNTEMGFVIDSPKLAAYQAEGFARRVPPRAYEVRLSQSRRLYWLERHTDGTTLRYDTEPKTSFGQRAAVWFLSLLPIDWLL